MIADQLITPEKTGSSGPLVLRLRPAIDLTDEQFFLFCHINPELRIERTAIGEIEVMPPAGLETGSRNAELTMQLRAWALREGTGIAVDSSTGFMLPNGAVRAPDAAWMPQKRLEELTAEQKQRFVPLCPDFVVELRSPSDNLSNVHEKMAEYMANGAKLGWLIDPGDRSLYIYRPNEPVAHLRDLDSVAAGPALPGFILFLSRIWDPGF